MDAYIGHVKDPTTVCGGRTLEEQGKTREFESGATRDSDDGKLDYEGFLSPLVLNAFAHYMHKHRIQSDGKLRDSDNWQRGMPLAVYAKSAWRHFFDFWAIHRGYVVFDEEGNAVELEDAVCGLLFNLQGYMHTDLGVTAQGLPIRRGGDRHSENAPTLDPPCITD